MENLGFRLVKLLAQWILEVIPNPCSRFCHLLPTNSHFKHFLKISLKDVSFNHVHVLPCCYFSASSYYLSGSTGTKKSLMLDVRKEIQPGCVTVLGCEHIMQKHLEYFRHPRFSQVY